MSVDRARDDVIDKVVAHARAQLGADDKGTEAFLRQYYSWVASEDLLERRVIDRLIDGSGGKSNIAR